MVDIEKLLKDSGAVLIRDSNHYVWKLPTGEIFVTAKTTSDVKSWRASLRDLKKYGIEPAKTPKSTTGKKKYKPKDNIEHTHVKAAKTFNSALKDKLQLKGVVEARLKEEICILEDKLKLHQKLLSEVIEENLYLKEELSLTKFEKFKQWIRGSIGVTNVC